MTAEQFLTIVAIATAVVGLAAKSVMLIVATLALVERWRQLPLWKRLFPRRP